MGIIQEHLLYLVGNQIGGERAKTHRPCAESPTPSRGGRPAIGTEIATKLGRDEHRRLIWCGRGRGLDGWMTTDLVEVDLGDVVGDVAPGGLGDLVADAPVGQELHHVEQVLLLPRPLRLSLRRRRRRSGSSRRGGAGAQGPLGCRRREPEGPPEETAHRPLRHGHRCPMWRVESGR